PAVLDQHGRVLVEADVRAVRPAALLDGAHDDGLDHVALLHAGAREGVLDGGDDHVADAGVAAARSTEHPDAEDFLSTGVVGDPQPRFLLNHVLLLTGHTVSSQRVCGCRITSPSRGSRPRASAWSPTAGGSPSAGPGRRCRRRSSRRAPSACWYG